MTIKEMYEQIVAEINDLDKGIEYMKGKREALNGVRLDLFQMIENQEAVKEGSR